MKTQPFLRLPGYRSDRCGQPLLAQELFAAAAATIIERHGSAARGNPVYECGTLIGKVMRSVFMLDYLVNPEFRREIHRLLAQGESLHALQRALLTGRIEAKHGRTDEDAAAISGALTLLTNIVLAWNTEAMQREIVANPAQYPAEHLPHIAPVAHRPST